MIAADRRSVWKLVSDPYHRTRWWPKVSRVEDVHETAGGSGSQWTDVLTTASGKGVRAEFRCVWARDLESYGWEQKIEGTPFAKVLSSSVTSVDLEDRDQSTYVAIEVNQRLRGLSRLGGFMLKRATGAQVAEALNALEQVLGEREQGTGG